MAEEHKQMDSTEVTVRLRRRRKRHPVAKAILAALALTAVFVFFTGAFSSYLLALGDLFDSVKIAVTQSGDFPVQTGINEVYQAQPLSGGFVALGQEDCVVVSSSGGLLRSIQAGYARPTLAVGRNRFVLYNRSGKELRIENRTQTLYTQTMENNILTCAMSEKGTLAVAVDSNRYLAELSVYSSDLSTRKYLWQMTSTEGTPLCMAFAGDDRRLAVGTVTAKGGELVGSVYLLETNSDAVRWHVSSAGSVPLALIWQDNGHLLVLFDSFAAVYNQSGEEQSRYEFGTRQLAAYSVEGKSTALLFSGETSGTVIVLNGSLKETAEVMTPAASGITLTGNAFYVICGFTVRQYALNGTFVDSTDWEVRPQAVVNARKTVVLAGNNALLLDAAGDGNS